MSVIVVPISTSLTQSRRGPTVVKLPAGVGGISRESVVLCHQVTTLDRSKLTQKVGALPHDHVSAVNAAIKAALDLE
jgi:mRNA interferase MazF